ncbi:MAG: hypothetical protein MJ133_12050 [Lachnospiraceae bacterium]|nr:hypothetical protein [Lachnospiraceae bacterium]
MENKDTAQYIMQELAKFLTPEELVKISVNEIANKTNSIGFFKKNNYWFIYENDDRMYTSYSGPYDPEHLVYDEPRGTGLVVHFKRLINDEMGEKTIIF